MDNGTKEIIILVVVLLMYTLIPFIAGLCGLGHSITFKMNPKYFKILISLVWGVVGLPTFLLLQEFIRYKKLVPGGMSSGIIFIVLIWGPIAAFLSYLFLQLSSILFKN